MPRRPRIDVPGLPQHIVQRGIDRQPCFFTDADRRRYLDFLRKIAPKRDCSIHAYVLMTHHVHLLVTPGTPGAEGRMMQDLRERTLTPIRGFARYAADAE